MVTNRRTQRAERGLAVASHRHKARLKAIAGPARSKEDCSDRSFVVCDDPDFLVSAIELQKIGSLMSVRQELEDQGFCESNGYSMQIVLDEERTILRLTSKETIHCVECDIQSNRTATVALRVKDKPVIVPSESKLAIMPSSKINHRLDIPKMVAENTGEYWEIRSNTSVERLATVLSLIEAMAIPIKN